MQRSTLLATALALGLAAAPSLAQQAQQPTRPPTLQGQQMQAPEQLLDAAPPAGQATQAPGPTPASLAAADLAFVLQAAEGGIEEVVLGQLAQERATNDAIRQFGQRMVQDHSRANEELITIAAARGARPPEQLAPASEAVRQTLAALAPDGFDAEYIAHQVAAHEVALALFQHAAGSASSPALVQFAQRTAPIVQEHLQLAQSLHQQLNQPSGAAPQQPAAGQQPGHAQQPAPAQPAAPAQ